MVLWEIAQQVFRLPLSFHIPLVLALITNSILHTCFRSRPTIIKLLFILVLGLALINQGNFKDVTHGRAVKAMLCTNLIATALAAIFF